MFKMNRLSGEVSLYVKHFLSYETFTDLALSDTTIEIEGMKFSISMYDLSILGNYCPHSDSIENFPHDRNVSLKLKNWTTGKLY